MKRIRGRGRALVALTVVLAVFGLLTTGCIGMGGKVAVRAVARGVPTAAPFFKQAMALGADIAVGKALADFSGERDGGDPGLYGGTRDAGRCDKAKLVEFLEKPENRGKAQEWAKTQGLDGVGEIEGFVKRLTPVVLRADTLVRNHDFVKGRAKAFDALLEAGIAVLVDQFGKPAVQCTCGNPLKSFDHGIGDADVKFDDRNKEWSSYDSKKVTKVKPAPKEEPVEVYELVDVEEPDSGLARETGSDGTDDEVLPEAPGGPSEGPSGEPSEETGPPVEVPEVRGLSLEEAQVRLEAAGFEVATAEEASDTALPGTVLGQSPEPATQAPSASLVTVTVAVPGGSQTGAPPVSGEPTDGVGTGEGTVGGQDGGTGEVGEAGEVGGGSGSDGGGSGSGGLFGGAAEGQ
ncbi:serine/threonine kinase [Streptomyces sp. AS58]|uniref:PASTA domain-containing protein n=1 Tax=Streptomyces sp. AS58 TaxID=1519489 RepID=UPI0006AFEBFF|nr:PASTA domain-containing protein [Streptomyces sp. AS58]KOV59939.1 serine/threonine kinase [Streptomyces sp. AS58]